MLLEKRGQLRPVEMRQLGVAQGHAQMNTETFSNLVARLVKKQGRSQGLVKAAGDMEQSAVRAMKKHGNHASPGLGDQLCSKCGPGEFFEGTETPVAASANTPCREDKDNAALGEGLFCFPLAADVGGDRFPVIAKVDGQEVRCQVVIATYDRATPIE